VDITAIPLFVMAMPAGGRTSRRRGCALKACEPIVVSGERRLQGLIRDLSFQLGIGGPIRLPHPALSDLLSDFVDAEARAGSEGQGLRDYTGEKVCGPDRSS
jgi:hypothetical protein